VKQVQSPCDKLKPLAFDDASYVLSKDVSKLFCFVLFSKPISGMNPKVVIESNTSVRIAESFFLVLYYAISLMCMFVQNISPPLLFYFSIRINVLKLVL